MWFMLVSSFCMFFCGFVFIDDGSGIGRKIQAVILSFFALLILPKFKMLMLKKTVFTRLNMLFLLYLVVMCFSSYMSTTINANALYHKLGFEWLNRTLHLSSWTLSIYYALTFFISLLFIEYVELKGKTAAFLYSFEKVILFYLIIVDFSRLTSIDFGFSFGGKFVESYYHIFFLIIYATRKHFLSHAVTMKKMCIMALWPLLFAMYVDCYTAIFGLLIVLVLFFIYQSDKQKGVYSSKTLFLILAISASFILTHVYIMNSDAFNAFLHKIGRIETMTSRTKIYAVALPFALTTGLWGVGYGNSVFYFKYLFAFPNAQNGLVDMIISEGIFSVCLFMFVLRYAINLNRKEKNQENTKYVFIFLVMYFTLSCVEVTLGSYVVCLLPLMLLGMVKKEARG